jgi:hypothetical protein
MIALEPILEALLEAHARGESLIAVNGQKRPWYGWKVYQAIPASEEQLREWAADRRSSAFAVVTGELSKLIVLDFDEEAGIRLLEQLGLEPHVQTGRGGYHVRLSYPGHRVATQNSKVTKILEAKWPGLDIRADGGYAIEWGASEHGRYRILRDLTEPVPIEALPEELAVDLGLVRRGTLGPALARAARQSKVTEGHRHRHLHDVGSAMRGRGHEVREIEAELLRVNRADCDPPKPEQLVRELAADIAQRYPRGGPAGDPQREDPTRELRRLLTEALKVGPADWHVESAEINGKGLSAVCAVGLRSRSGEATTIEIDRFSQLTQPSALAGLVSFYTGVGETFTQKECARISGLVRRLAHVQNDVGDNDIARDYGVAFLQAAAVWDVDLESQAERWGAISQLKDRDPVALARENKTTIAASSIVLRDLHERRYVHSGWFHEFVRRDCSGLVGAPELYGRMGRLGWERRGRRGRIKATEPGGSVELQVPMFIVPPGWETGS